jgi:DNA gyrase/topoisomerase IV subunit B
MVRKTVMGGGGLPGKFLIVQSKIQNEKYLVEGDSAGERQNKVVTVLFKQFTITW